MGGDGQPQFQAQIFLDVERRNDIAAAIDAPRFLLGRTWGQTSATLKLESRYDESVVARLKKYGHDVELLPPYSDTAGHAGMIMRFPDGAIEAAHDPRSDGASDGI
jgi:oxamate amidohydrolase